MTLLYMSPVLRAMLCFATILLFLLCSVDITVAFRQRNRAELTVSLGLFLCNYVLHQIVKTVILYRVYGQQAQQAQIYGEIPAWLLLVAMLILSGLGIAILYRLIVWKRSHVTPASVKESIDNLPSGLAFYEDDGSCMLVNHTMNRISSGLTGHAVMNGRELERALENGGMPVEQNGRKYQISHRQFLYGKEHIHELVADDITELQEKTEMLSRRNAELADMNRRLKQYSVDIDETVRKQEILQAKIQIHDEMNRLLLATGNAAEGTVSPGELEKLLSTWKNNALLLCREADNEVAGNTQQDLQTLADIIGIKLEWDGAIATRDPQVLQLLELATGEAMNNAVKHARAGHLYMKLQENEKEIVVTYTNDGLPPKGEVRPAGGLKNLSQMLESIRGGTYIHGNRSEIYLNHYDSNRRESQCHIRY